MANFTIAAAVAAIFAAGLFISAPARAESVMKQCGAEWKAAKAANTTNGETWREYLKDCRTRLASTPATTAPAAAAAEPAPARGESVMKQCGEQWKAAKAAKTTNGQTWREFLKDCRTRVASTNSTAPAAPAPAAEPAPAANPASTRTRRTAHTTAGEFASEGEAKGHCPSDTVVWVNNRSHKFHYSGDRYYGTTKHGAYMCERDATAAGDAAAKNSKPKS